MHGLGYLTMNLKYWLSEEVIGNSGDYWLGAGRFISPGNYQLRVETRNNSTVIGMKSGDE
jgi:hypothetical protein